MVFCWACKHCKKYPFPMAGDEVMLPECTLPSYAGDEAFCPYYEADEEIKWFPS